jgi:hypothetical protein
MRGAALLAVALVLLLPASGADARITTIVFTRIESPTFDGRVFGTAGQYEKLVGTAFGEVDPRDPRNALIQDLALAPRNARGMVEYSTDLYILKPVDLAKGGRTLFYELPNRGDKYALSFTFNVGAPWGNDPTEPGDGFLQKLGYTIIWSGWQADVLPGGGRMTMQVPVARYPDGSPITGVVRSELIVREPTPTLNLSSGWFTGPRHASYPTVSLDTRTPLPDGFLPTLTVRTLEQDPRVPIERRRWAFGACPDGVTLTPSPTQVCLFEGFRPGRIYELIYQAKDPFVLGLGYAGIRDLVAFLKHERRDDAGTPNPLWLDGSRPRALVVGTSQGGRNVRTFVHLGFNQDEGGRIVFEGALPHVAAGRAALNIRFGQPGRAWGHQFDRLYPAYEFPFAYAAAPDPLTGRTGGVLARCLATGTCPKIFHVVSAHELWDGRDSLNRTDPLGRRDLEEPPVLRTYVLASAQHAPAERPSSGRPPSAGDCQYPRNPNPQRESMRALVVALTRWVNEGVEPPPSEAPRIRDGTLVPADRVRFPRIPGVRFLALANGLSVLDFGPLFRGEDESGAITVEPPRVVGSRGYTVLVPQVDADGNDLAGIRSTAVQAPVATYTGWNAGRAGLWQDQLCSLQGSFIPFARTRAERLAAGDPRPSLAERYGTHAGYVAAVRAAAARLAAQRFLLPDDAARLVGEAEASDVLRP